MKPGGIIRKRTDSSGGFTLLEIMLAVLVFALIAMSIFRFVVTDLEAITISTDDSTRKGQIRALVAVLQEEFCNLPPAGSAPGALAGQAHQFSGKASDEVEWLSQAGNGLFTEAAEGSWKITLLLRQQEKSNTYTLGLLRQLPDNSNKDEHWLPLLRDVDAIEVRYFDPRLNMWNERWADDSAYPTLVRVRIWRTNATVPYEAVIELPPTQVPS